MNKTLTRVVLLLSLTLTAACTSFKTSNKHMSIHDDAAVTPESGRALFLFQRDNARVAEWYAVGVWEITDGNPRLVGLLHGTMKAEWSVEPGKHDFMLTLAGRCQILRTQVDADKTYFVEVNHTQWGGLGPAGYSFCPVRAGDDNPMTATRVGSFNPSAGEWESRTLESANSHATRAYAQWEEYSDDIREQLTMLPEDGR